jgi:hypothetical protein
VVIVAALPGSPSARSLGVCAQDTVVVPGVVPAGQVKADGAEEPPALGRWGQVGRREPAIDVRHGVVDLLSTDGESVADPLRQARCHLPRRGSSCRDPGLATNGDGSQFPVRACLGIRCRHGVPGPLLDP